MIQEQGCVHERECVCVCVSERENGCVCVSEREGRVFVSVCVSSRFGPQLGQDNTALQLEPSGARLKAQLPLSSEARTFALFFENKDTEKVLCISALMYEVENFTFQLIVNQDTGKGQC